MPYLDRRGDVFVLFLGESQEKDSENWIDAQWLEQVEDLLDRVTRHAGPAALVTTATGKFYCSGVNMDVPQGGSDAKEWLLDRVHGVFARLLGCDMPTVAAVNGHAFGGGALLALTHDFRVMRADRGWFCLPEVQLNAALTPGAHALLNTRLPRQVAVEALVTGRRYGGPQALAAGIVDDLAEEAALVDSAVARAAALTSQRQPVLGKIKQELYREALTALRLPTRMAEPID